jgi:enoyl-CoA hydratase/carnithine racemase
VTQEFVKVQNEKEVGIIVLDRPEKLNSMSFQMLSEIGDALEKLERENEVRAVILSGNEKTFSTGADLNEALDSKSGFDLLYYNRAWRKLTYQIEHLIKPVIAVVEGYCLTGGLEIAMCCDIRIVGDKSTFGITSSKIGSVAGVGGTQRLPRLIGPAMARELLFTSNFIGAEEALRIGLVNRVVPSGTALQAAREMVSVIATRAPLSIAWMKTAVNTGMNLDLESALDFEASLSAQAFATSDKEEGMRAFLEKRLAKFQGR